MRPIFGIFSRSHLIEVYSLYFAFGKVFGLIGDGLAAPCAAGAAIEAPPLSQMVTRHET